VKKISDCPPWKAQLNWENVWGAQSASTIDMTLRPDGVFTLARVANYKTPD